MTSPTPTVVSLTVGTAGHVDHGKTSLVKYLTGCDTDRLPEEIARGLTIDLGFAVCQLPNNRSVGIVDVPGHERFIHNMVAGATGIDAVVLVVAADDGVMPQTVEHFHIVRMLGVRSGMVVVTKTDLVTSERVANVIDQVRQLVADSFLGGAPIVPFSCKTGAGFDAFYEAFAATVDRTAQRNADGAFRMHVERSFVMKGIGTIVSGIPSSGMVRIGDTVELLPARKTKKIRGIQVFGRDSDELKAGECAGLKLADVSTDEVKRGMVLACPDTYVPTRFFDVRFQMLPSLDRPLRPRSGIRFHIGTSDAKGYLVLPNQDSLPPGSETYAQVQLDQPMVAAPGDFFVVRLLTPPLTLGGGNVVYPAASKMRRSQEDWSDSCRRCEQAFRQADTALQFLTEHETTSPLSVETLAQRAFLSKTAVKQHIAGLVGTGHVLALPGEKFISPQLSAAVQTRVAAAINTLHDASPLSLGFDKKLVFRNVSCDHTLIEHALHQLLVSGDVENTAQGIRMAARRPALDQRQTVLADRVVELYKAKAFASPRRDELPAILGVDTLVLNPVMDHLVQAGRLVALDGGTVLLHTDCVSEAGRKIAEYIVQHGQIEPGAVRDLLRTSRKYAIPLLEHFDRTGLTRRQGNARVLRAAIPGQVRQEKT